MSGESIDWMILDQLTEEVGPTILPRLLRTFYGEAEVRLGVSGEQGPRDMDPRAKPFPMPPLPLTYNLGVLKQWTDAAGIATWSQPSAKTSQPYHGRGACCRNDTCFPICPVGAKYSPDQTWNPLRAQRKVTLHTKTVVRRLVVDDASGRIVAATAVHRDREQGVKGIKIDAGKRKELQIRWPEDRGLAKALPAE